MVKIGLQFKAFLENVTGLQAEGEDFRLVVGLWTQNNTFGPAIFLQINL